MGSSSREEQTPEEKLVDDLVGIGMQIEGKVRDDAPLDRQREIKTIVKKSWVNGATCEEIERTYHENIKKSIDLEEKGVEDINFSKKFSDFGKISKEKFQKIDFNFIPKKGFKKINLNFISNTNLKNNVLNWWKDRKIFENVQKPKNDYSNLVLNKKNTGSLKNTSSKENGRFSNVPSSKEGDRFSNLGSTKVKDRFSNLPSSKEEDRFSNLPSSKEGDRFSNLPSNKENNKFPDSSSNKLSNNSFNDAINNKFRKSENNNSFNDAINNKFRKPENHENKASDSKSFIDFDEERYRQESMKENLVEELVGIGSSIGKELNSLNILDIYKFAIKSAVQSVWKEGRSIEDIQKTYDALATKHLQDKEELEKQKSLKIELDELKKESLIKKEVEKNKLKFEGYFQEIKKDFPSSDKEFFCTSILEDNTVLIEKKKPLSKTLCGENKILYLDILSAVYEKENPQYDYVQIYTTGFIFKLINKNRDNSLKDFYDKLMEKINKEKTFNVKKIKKDEESSYSTADELMKWHQLKEKGIITQEEFENEKDKLL